MGPKSITILVLLVIGLGIAVACMNGYFGQNDDQDWQVLQGVFGKMSVRTESGVYQKKFATPWTYPKVQRVYFSSDIKEGGTDDESCKVVFSDKGTATFSSMVLYRSPYLKAGLAIPDINPDGVLPKGLKEGEVANFHRLCKGDITIADKTVLAKIKEYARINAASMNASQSVENQAEFIMSIRTDLKNDQTLSMYGIEIEELTLSDIVFDDPTLLQFKKQQEAILASKEAEAKKIQFDMEKIKTVADYAQKIAEQKGLAEMEMMKQVTDAERDAELARIDAAKKVTVAALAKDEAETRANMALSVAAIEKKEALTIAAKNLEVAEFDAKAALESKKATIAKAEGKEKAIQLSGAITEKEEVLARIDADARVRIASSLKDIRTPSLVITGGKDGGSGFDGSMVNIAIMKAAGILPSDFSVSSPMTSTPVKK